jgi:hypothetical protein
LTVLESLQNITEANINDILKEYESMPRPDYSVACLKARGAATILCRPTWNIFSMSHVNALLIGLNRIKFSESYAIIKLMTTVECYSFGVMGQIGLGFEDFNLAIGPIAVVFSPESFTESQAWTQASVPRAEYVRPTYRTRKAKSARPDISLDVAALVDSLVKEAASSIPPPLAVVRVEALENSSVLDTLLKSISTTKKT